MAMEAYRGLLARFGAGIGLPELAPDEAGYCALSFDDTQVNLQLDPERGELTLFTKLGTVEDDEPGPLYARLLAANLFWAGTGGATLAVVPESQDVFLARKVPVASLDDQAFSAMLEAFIGAAETWRAEVAAYAGGEPAADRPVVDGGRPDPADGLIRI